MNTTRLTQFIIIGVVAAGTFLAAALPMMHSTLVVTHHEETTTFRYVHWLPALIGGVALLFFMVALLLVASGRGPGKLLLVGVILLIGGGGLAFALLHEKVTVSPTEFTIVTSTGQAWHIRYADLARIEVEERREQDGRRGTKVVYFMVCHFKDGKTETIDFTDLMQAAGEAKILQVARAHHIAIEDRAGRW